LLLDFGADINCGTGFGATGDGYYGRTALVDAVAARNIEIVKLLIRRGADVNKYAAGFAQNSDPNKRIIQYNALMIAQDKKDYAIAQILLKAGAKRIPRYSSGRR
jgi:ankyrin repeat protein